MAKDLADYVIGDRQSLVGKGKTQVGFDQVAVAIGGPWAGQRAGLIANLAPHLGIAIRDAGEQTKKLFDEVQRLATCDALTGIPNRRRFFELCDARVAAARPARVPLAALMIDIDHFKAVNDTYGHAAGDQGADRLRQRRRRHGPVGPPGERHLGPGPFPRLDFAPRRPARPC